VDPTPGACPHAPEHLISSSLDMGSGSGETNRLQKLNHGKNNPYKYRIKAGHPFYQVHFAFRNLFP
jgi:hypothetical protein